MGLGLVTSIRRTRPVTDLADAPWCIPLRPRPFDDLQADPTKRIPRTSLLRVDRRILEFGDKTATRLPIGDVQFSVVGAHRHLGPRHQNRFFNARCNGVMRSRDWSQQRMNFSPKARPSVCDRQSGCWRIKDIAPVSATGTSEPARADRFRDAMQDRRTKPGIPDRRSRGKPVGHDKRHCNTEPASRSCLAVATTGSALRRDMTGAQRSACLSSPLPQPAWSGDDQARALIPFNAPSSTAAMSLGRGTPAPAPATPASQSETA